MCLVSPAGVWHPCPCSIAVFNCAALERIVHVLHMSCRLLPTCIGSFHSIFFSHAPLFKSHLFMPIFSICCVFGFRLPICSAIFMLALFTIACFISIFCTVSAFCEGINLLQRTQFDSTTLYLRCSAAPTHNKWLHALFSTLTRVATREAE